MNFSCVLRRLYRQHDLISQKAHVFPATQARLKRRILELPIRLSNQPNCSVRKRTYPSAGTAEEKKETVFLIGNCPGPISPLGPDLSIPTNHT